VSGPMFGGDERDRAGGASVAGGAAGPKAATQASRGRAGRARLVTLGLLNGRLDWHSLTRARLGGAAHDRFEDALLDATHRSDDGKFEAAARAALFMTGNVTDSVRVTLRYDSEHAAERRLFGDIRPNDGYDMLGDASVHGFDTQSTDRVYARLERGASYAQYGDFATPASPERALGAFSRRLNGGLGVLAIGPTRWEGFVSQGRQHQVIDEFPALGISGPYTLSRSDGTLGSEQVEVVVRDRADIARAVET